MPLGTEVGLGPGHAVLDGDPAPPSRKKGHISPQLSAHIYCGQNGWMDQDVICTEVDLLPGHIVLDGVPAPPSKKGHIPPIFGPCLLWPNAGWIEMPLGMEIGLRLGHIVLDRDPVLPKKVHNPTPSPIFGPCLLRPNGCMDLDATW